MREELLKLIFERSFRYDPDFGFKLASGKTSDVYIDLKKTVLSAVGMELTGRVLFDMVRNDDIKGIGGLTLGADPIAYSTAMISNQSGKPLEAFVIRKEAKKHGTQRWIEGSLCEGDPVVIIDDVVTTGGSTVKAIERAIEGGLDVVKVLALVDREEGGGENIAAVTDAPFLSAFTKTELLTLQRESAG
jgi:orotate phosphoribosyltransferase